MKKIFSKLWFFILLIPILIVDGFLAFKMFENAQNFSNGGYAFLFILLIMTFLKIVLIKFQYISDTTVATLADCLVGTFIQGTAIIFTTYVNLFLADLAHTIAIKTEMYYHSLDVPSSFFGVLLWYIWWLLIAIFVTILENLAFIIALLILYVGIIIPFAVTLLIYFANYEVKKEIKLKQEEKVKKELDEQYKSEANSIRHRIDELAKLNLIIDYFNADKIESLPTSLMDDWCYIYDENLNIIQFCKEPININNETKYHYYKDAVQKLYNEFKDVLKYTSNDVQDSHEFLLRFSKDIKRYLRTIDLEYKSIGIREEEKSFINARREHFIEYYLDQRMNQIIADNYSIKLGYEGEELVNQTLSMHHNLINLSNIRIEMDGKSVECDNIILSTKGIFILEVKNIGNSGKFIIKIEKDGRWLKKKENSEEIEHMNNATAQNNYHIAYINRLLDKELGHLDIDFNVNGAVIIANKNVTIDNDSLYQTVIRTDEIYNYISSQPIIYNKEQLNMIKEVIMKHSLPPKSYPVYEYVDELIRNTKQILDVLHKGEKLLKEHSLEVNNLPNKYSKYLI